MLSPVYRLRKNYQFSYIYRKGTSSACKNMILIYTKAGGGIRVGFSVSNKLGKATVRNKIRRRMRESVRGAIPLMRPGVNCVFIARPETDLSTFGAIDNSVRYLLKKNGLLK